MRKFDQGYNAVAFHPFDTLYQFHRWSTTMKFTLKKATFVRHCRYFQGRCCLTDTRPLFAQTDLGLPQRSRVEIAASKVVSTLLSANARLRAVKNVNSAAGKERVSYMRTMLMVSTHRLCCSTSCCLFWALPRFLCFQNALSTLVMPR